LIEAVLFITLLLGSSFSEHYLHTGDLGERAFLLVKIYGGGSFIGFNIVFIDIKIKSNNYELKLVELTGINEIRLLLT